jgi:hypothetical protein
MDRKPTHIIVLDLNKVRWLTPNQVHLTNVFPYTPENLKFFDDNQVPYWLGYYNVFTKQFDRTSD